MRDVTAVLPVLVQIFLIFGVLFRLAQVRFGAAARGEVQVDKIAIDNTAWAPDIRKVANSFSNQFELPILFFVLVAFTLILHLNSTLFVGMEWVFVLSRVVHALIHCTSNNVQHRFRAFAVGLFTLIAMWIIFAVRVVADL